MLFLMDFPSDSIIFSFPLFVLLTAILDCSIDFFSPLLILFYIWVRYVVSDAHVKNS